jgi:hypothetical protein
MWKKKLQRTPKTTSGRVFSSNSLGQVLSFAAALRGQGTHQPHQEAQANISNPEATTTKTEVQETGQLVQAAYVYSEPQDKMFRVITVVHQIMAELKGAASVNNEPQDKMFRMLTVVHQIMAELKGAASVNNEPQDKTFRAITVVHQIMAELKGAASEDAKLFAIAKIVCTLRKEDGK